MQRWTAFVIALVLLAASGLVHGRWTERWRQSEPLQDALARVSRAPLQVGAWKGKEQASKEEEFAQAGAQAYWMRTYTNPRLRTTVLAILMCGRAGRMSVHTPEVCYRGAGYEIVETPSRLPLQSETGEELGTFWTARFVKSAGVASDLRLYWAWTAHGPWQAPSSPRWEFRSEPYLYKLYVSVDAPSGIGQTSEAVLDFLRAMAPELERTVTVKNAE
ncbi:MAG: EpsI family protein [Gemmataceae bacterium]|nr:EpsI family protein [Gemmataceae bacterium]MCI0739264.1 EpsI family protein [Gemmataceae bacterium]